MNDFFTPESPGELRTISTEEEQEIREKLQAQVFDGVPAKFDDDAPAKPDEEAEVAEEESAEVEAETELEEPTQPELSPEMQAIVDSVNKLNTSITTMESRIKQTERRVGSMSNEFYAAKTAADEAAIAQTKAPTPEEMAVAAKDSEAWEGLKKDFPSWATAIKSKIAAQTSNFVSVDDFEALRKSVSQTSMVDANQLEARLVGLIHPDYQQIVQDPKYTEWLTNQSEDLRHKAYQGTTAEEAIDVFNQFKASQAKPASDPAINADPSEVKQIKAQRKKRLETSTITNTNHKTIKPKAEADMTEAELREHIAAKVFAK